MVCDYVVCMSWSCNVMFIQIRYLQGAGYFLVKHSILFLICDADRLWLMCHLGGCVTVNGGERCQWSCWKVMIFCFVRAHHICLRPFLVYLSTEMSTINLELLFVLSLCIYRCCCFNPHQFHCKLQMAKQAKHQSLGALNKNINEQKHKKHLAFWKKKQSVLIHKAPTTKSNVQKLWGAGIRSHGPGRSEALRKLGTTRAAGDTTGKNGESSGNSWETCCCMFLIDFSRCQKRHKHLGQISWHKLMILTTYYLHYYITLHYSWHMA